MSHKSKESLIYQVKKVFDSLDCTGQSKHDAKDEYGHVDGVYSYETMSKYKSVCRNIDRYQIGNISDDMAA